MGLIKAAAGALGGTMADQWKEFFYCDAIENEVLAVKGEKRVSGRSSNKRGNDNIISSGSGMLWQTVSVCHCRAGKSCGSMCGTG